MLLQKMALLLAFLFSPSAHSALIEDDAIIVTADRIKGSLDKSTSNISVFENEEIKKAQSFSDLLKGESDLRLIESGPIGSSASLFLRGSDSSHTLVFIDGIMMNDPSNPNRQFDFGRLSLNNIERIEILKSSQGLLYGSNAIGGVILITSKKAGKTTTGSAQIDYGTYNTLSSAFNIQKTLYQTSLSLGADYLTSDGFSVANKSFNPGADNDGEIRKSLNFALSQPTFQNGEFKANYHYVNDKTDLDNGGGRGNDDPNDSQFTEQQFFKLAHNQKWNTGETEIAFGQSIHHRTLSVLADIKSSTNSQEISRGITKTFDLNHTHYTSEKLTQNINLTYTHEKDRLNNFNENLSLFSYNKIELSQNVLNFGVRLDKNKQFGEHLTYKLAHLITLEKLLLKTSYSTGFRSPSLNQLYDLNYGNKDLSPEKSQTIETGIDLAISSNLKYQMSLFFTQIKDRLSYDPITFKNQNRGKAQIQGVENNLESKINEEFNTRLSLTWMSAKEKTLNQKLARRPNLSSAFMIEYLKNKHTIDFEGVFTGKRADVDNLGNSLELPSHMIFHLSYFAKLNQHFSSYVKVKNLLDKDYEEIFGYGTAGRTLTAGVKYIF